MSFAELEAPANVGTTWDTKPAVKEELGEVKVGPGEVEGGYVVWSGACEAGETVGYEVGEGSGGDTVLVYFQDYNPSPIGIYVFPC